MRLRRGIMGVSSDPFGDLSVVDEVNEANMEAFL